jgi:nitrogen regulatory protein P-II 1
MKLISCIVRMEKLEAVKTALDRIQVSAIAAAEVHDYAPQKRETVVWRGHECDLGFSLKIAISVIVDDETVDETVKAIICAARTGQVGDGHVSVSPVDHRYSIRTGERESC